MTSFEPVARTGPDDDITSFCREVMRELDAELQVAVDAVLQAGIDAARMSILCLAGTHRRSLAVDGTSVFVSDLEFRDDAAHVIAYWVYPYESLSSRFL